MDAIVLGVLLFTILSVLFGFVLGLIRGTGRSIARLILIVLCAVGALFLKDVITDAILGLQIEGQTIPQLIQSALAKEGQAFPTELVDFIISFASLMVGIIAYFICFIALQGITWLIVFQILKIFIKKNKNKGTLVGGLIGLVQGFIVAFAICAPLTGLFVQLDKISTSFDALMPTPEQAEVSADGFISNEIVVDGQTFNISFEESNEGQEPPIPEVINATVDLKPYIQSPVGKFYIAIGNWYYQKVATIIDADGDKITLEATTSVLSTMVNLVSDVQEMSGAIDKLSDPNVTESEALSSIGEVLIGVGENFDEMGEEGKVIFEELLDGIKEFVVPEGSTEVPEDVKEFVDNLTVEDLNLKSAGEAFVALSHYADNESEILAEITEEDAKAIVKGISDNSFVMDLIGETTILDVPSEDKEVFASAIESLTDISEEDKQTLYSMFNIK